MRMWLKNLREDKRLSRQEVANKLDIDVEYYELLENGRLPINIPVLLAAKISDLFTIPISRLIIYEGEYKDFKNIEKVETRLNLVSQQKCNNAEISLYR